MKAANVTYVEADLFGWEPVATYDLVFFGFWISHVPKEALVGFWEKIAGALRPGGRVFLVDNLWVPGRIDHSNEDLDQGTTTRELEDGRAFRIVKVFYDAASLAGVLEPLGWSCGLHDSSRYLLHGTASR